MSSTIISQEIQPLLRKIVRVIEKSIGEDIRDYKMLMHKETNNAIPQMRGDNINTNLREYVVSDTVELKHFKRGGWEGCLLVDREHKITFTIMTERTLAYIPKVKGRQRPHYLQTLVYVLNGGVEAPVKQMHLSDYDKQFLTDFSEEEYIDDFHEIMDDELNTEEYCHYVVVYASERMQITSIALKYLDKDWDTIQEISWMDYVQLDFAQLTENESGKLKQIKDAHSLVSVKKGIDKGEAGKNVVIRPKEKERSEA